MVPCQLYESTAADRAAADMQRGGRILKGSNSLTAVGAFLMLCGRSQRVRSSCWMGAAALSAAVTLLKPIGDSPNAQAEPSQKKSTLPNASRSSGERGLGGEALLSEKRPLPPESPSPSHSIHDRPTMPGPPLVPTTVPISSCMMGGRLERLEVR